VKQAAADEATSVGFNGLHGVISHKTELVMFREHCTSSLGLRSCKNRGLPCDIPAILSVIFHLPPICSLSALVNNSLHLPAI
jgi:hypothetical protein